MYRRVIIIASFLLIAIMIYGCGQTTQVTSSTATPRGLSIRGTVYNINLPNFTIGDVIADAYVSLDGAGADVSTSSVDFTYATRTDANGEYCFVDIPDGTYSITVTIEGYLYWNPQTTVTIKPNSSGVPADETITTADISFYKLAFIREYSPADGSIISNDQTFTVTFNAPMDPATVRFNLVPTGVRTSAIPGDTCEMDLTWASDYRSVSISPRGDLISNEAYELRIDHTAWSSNPFYPMDASGGRFIGGENVGGGADGICNSWADYNVVAGGLPGAPSNLTISYNNGAINTTEVDANDIWNNMSSGNKIFLCWDSPTSGGPISGYNVYIANGDKSYIKLNALLITENKYTTNMDSIDTAFGWGSSQRPDPVCMGGYPFINNPCKIKVVALNGDGESIAGTTLEAKDSIQPTTTGQKSANSGYTGGFLPSGRWLPGISNTEVGIAYIWISEPLDTATVSGNFTITGVTLTATIYDQGFPASGDFSVIKLDAGSTDIRTKTVNISSAVKDLAGNPFAAGSAITLD